MGLTKHAEYTRSCPHMGVKFAESEDELQTMAHQLHTITDNYKQRRSSNVQT